MKMKSMHLTVTLLGMAGLGVVVFFLMTKSDPLVEERNTQALETLDKIPARQEPQSGFGPRIEEILTLRKSGQDDDMIRLLRSLDSDLDSRQQGALLAEILHPKPETMSVGAFSAYCHEICLVLIKQDNRDKRFASSLATIVNDEDQAPVLRDYGIQHLRNLWDVSREDPSLQSEIEETFVQLVDDTALGASSLLSLHLMGLPTPISQKGQPSVRKSGTRIYHVSNDQLSPLLQQSLDQKGNAEHQLTAIRIISERQLPGFEEFLRSAASSRQDQHALVQMAAIGTLSKSDDPQDKKFIESIRSTDPRVARALTLALKN